MKNILTIILLFFSSHVLSGPIDIMHNSILLNGYHSTNSQQSDSIAIILHGTRGHQNLELMTSLRDSLLENNLDSLTINLSYDISNRVSDFLPCDIEHHHKQSHSQKEIKTWYQYLIKMGYKKIYLIGHSRGGLDIMNFYENLAPKDQDLVESIFLIAPISDTWKSSIIRYKEDYDIDINDLLSEESRKLKINFLGCEDTIVHRDSFLDYYLISNDDSFFNNNDTKFANKGLSLHLINTLGKVYVITASEDNIVKNTHLIVKPISKNKKNIELRVIEGADHFFRDFYFDDLLEIILEEIL